MKTLFVDGRLTKDAEAKVSRDGRNYVKFSIAHNEFSNGEEVTEYYDVCAFDSFTVSKRMDFLKKGRYVIVQGNYEVKPNVKDGKLYINHWVNAVSVEFPRIGGRRQEDGGTDGVSTYSGQPAYQKPQAPAFQQAQIQIPQAAPAQQPAAPQPVQRPQPVPQMPGQASQQAPQPMQQMHQQAPQPAQFEPSVQIPQPQMQPQPAQFQQPAPQQFVMNVPEAQGFEEDDDLPF